MAQHTARLVLRLTPEARRTLEAAAGAGRSVSEFVLESALIRADEMMADRSRIVLDAEQWEAFLAPLDAPPRDLPRLERPLGEPTVFERDMPPIQGSTDMV